MGLSQVHGLYVVTFLIWTLIFKRYLARLVVKYEHQKAMCYDEIGACAQEYQTMFKSNN